MKTQAIADAVTLFQSQHREHSAQFQAATTNAGGVEARHAAVLAQVLNSLGDESAEPVAAVFQVTDKAVMAGTGVA